MGRVIMSGQVSMMQVQVPTGRVVKIMEDGIASDWTIVHVGNPDPSFYDSSCNGIWLFRNKVYCLATDTFDTPYKEASEIWPNTDMCTYLNSTFYNKFDSVTKSKIKECKIPYFSAYGASGECRVSRGSNGATVKLFEPSAYELDPTGYNQTIYTNNLDGIMYDGKCLNYFNTSDAASLRTCSGDGPAYGSNSNSVTYYCRTLGATCNWYVYIDGTNGTMGAIGKYGASNIRPMMILDKSTKFDSDGYIISD